MDFLQRVPLLLITAALLIGGVIENDIGTGSQAMLGVGFVCLGAWLCIEIQTWHRKLWSKYYNPNAEPPIVTVDQDAGLSIFRKDRPDVASRAQGGQDDIPPDGGSGL